MKDKPTLVLIHGAGASPSCWNFIYSQLDVSKYYIFACSYDIKKNCINDISSNLANILSDVDDITIIGHSLGGIIGFDLASKLKNKVKNLITISSPFSGLDLNLFIKSLLIMKIPFLVDIFKNSSYLKKLSREHIQSRWTMIKTKGAGFGVFFNEENDGVLTYKDQQAKCFKQAREEIEIEANHLEILLNFNVVKIIKEILQN